jgi:hypothetical protein
VTNLRFHGHSWQSRRERFLRSSRPPHHYICGQIYVAIGAYFMAGVSYTVGAVRLSIAG